MKRLPWIFLLVGCAGESGTLGATVEASGQSAVGAPQTLHLTGLQDATFTTVQWRVKSAPEGSGASVLGSGEFATFVPDRTGEYLIEARASDRSGQTGTRTKTLNIDVDCSDLGPSIFADQGEHFELPKHADRAECAAVSIAFRWTLEAAPAGAESTFDAHSVVLAGAGEYVFSYQAEIVGAEAQPIRRLTLNARDCAPVPNCTPVAGASSASVGTPAISLTATSPCGRSIASVSASLRGGEPLQQVLNVDRPSGSRAAVKLAETSSGALQLSCSAVDVAGVRATVATSVSIAAKHFNPAQWASKHVALGMLDDQTPLIAAQSEQRALVAYELDRTSGQWQQTPIDTATTSAEEKGLQPSLAIAGQTASVAYIARTGATTGEVRVARKANGTWMRRAQATIASVTTTDVKQVKLLVAPDGIAHHLFVVSSTSTPTLALDYRYCASDCLSGGVWSNVAVPLGIDPGQPKLWLAMDATGAVWLSYQKVTRAIHVARCGASCSTFSESPALAVTTGGSSEFSMAIDPVSGKPAMLFINDSTADVFSYFRACTGDCISGAWTTPEAVAFTPLNSPSLVFSREGTAYVISSNGPYGQRHRVRLASGVWENFEAPGLLDIASADFAPNDEVYGAAGDGLRAVIKNSPTGGYWEYQPLR
jgi:hypothetical protein